MEIYNISQNESQRKSTSRRVVTTLRNGQRRTYASMRREITTSRVGKPTCWDDIPGSLRDSRDAPSMLLRCPLTMPLLQFVALATFKLLCQTSAKSCNVKRNLCENGDGKGSHSSMSAKPPANPGWFLKGWWDRQKQRNQENVEAFAWRLNLCLLFI